MREDCARMKIRPAPPTPCLPGSLELGERARVVFTFRYSIYSTLEQHVLPWMCWLVLGAYRGSGGIQSRNTSISVINSAQDFRDSRLQNLSQPCHSPWCFVCLCCFVSVVETPFFS